MARPTRSRLSIDFDTDENLMDFFEQLKDGGILPRDTAVYVMDGLHSDAGNYRVLDRIVRRDAPGNGIEKLTVTTEDITTVATVPAKR